MEARIRERRPGDLSPLDESAVPLEVAPLVLSVNDLLSRLNDSIGTQKRFLADAAHQLKTPLAGLRMQADLAQREGANADELKQSLKQIGRASVRATHTVNQLLSLARAESSGANIGRQPLRPRAAHDRGRARGRTARDRQAHRPRLRRRRGGRARRAAGWQSDAAEGTGAQPARQRDQLHALEPERPGVITARVLADPFGRIVVLQVEDNGPGIPESERELVFQPFYRVLGNEADGSGLGLPIVREIARQHFATVRLEDAHPGSIRRGTLVSLRFDGNEGERHAVRPR